MASGAARLLVVALCGLAVVACTDDDRTEAGQGGEAQAEARDDTTTTTDTYARWRITEADDGYDIDAGTYRAHVSTVDGLALTAVDADGAPLPVDPPDGGFVAVVDGVEVPVESVTETILGVDHMSFEVSFGDAGPGRVDLAAADSVTTEDPPATDDVAALAVRVTLDSRPDVSEHVVVLGAPETG